MPEIPKTFSKIQLPPINKKNQVSLIEMVLLIVIIGLFYFFVVSPKNAELATVTTKVDALKLEQSKIESQKKALEGFIKDMKSSPEAIARLNEALPLNGKVLAVNLIAEKLISESGVSSDSLSFAAGTDAPAAGNRDLILNPYSTQRNLKKITGAVSVKGQFGQVQTFLEKLEESGRIFDISDLQISVDGQNIVHMSVTLATYYFAP